MNTVDLLRECVSAGRFTEAARILPDLVDRSVDALRVEVLERVGRYTQCQGVLDTLLKSKHLEPSDRSICEYASGLMQLNKGEVDGSIRHFNRSASLAIQAGDLERLCWAQLRLVSV